MDPTYSAFMADSFGEQLRVLREAAGMTQEAFAERAKCASSFISNVETGARSAPPDDIDRWAAILGLHGRMLTRFLQLAMVTHLPERFQPVMVQMIHIVDRYEASLPLPPIPGPGA